MDRLFAFIIAMVITMALVPPLARVAGRWGVLDAPGARKVHAQPIPRVGGIAMFIGFLAPLLLWLPIDRLLGAYLVAAVVLVAFGVWDDRATLASGPKFVGQLLAVAIVVFGGDLSIHSMLLGDAIAVSSLPGTLVAVLFLLGITNAINLSDGLDGLAAGTTLLCCCALALLAANAGNAFVLTMAVVLSGSILGFLRYNTYPARIFMGDGGSQFLGFTAGVLSLALTQQPGIALGAALPLLLLALPIIDTVMVMTLRMREGRSPFVADRKHLHHRLLGLGFTHYEAVVTIYLVQSLLILIAWQLRFASDLLVLAVFASVGGIVAGSLWLAERSGWRWRARTPLRSAPLRLRHWLSDERRLPRWTLRVAGLCVGCYLLSIGGAARPIPVDVAWLAVALSALLATTLLRHRSEGWLDATSQMVLYVGVVMAVYLDHLAGRQDAWLATVKWVVLPGLAIATLLHLRFGGERRFQLTPLDVLLLVAALVLPNLPGLSGGPSDLGLSVAKLMVLLYAVEMLFRHSVRLRLGFSVVVVTFLATVASRGLYLY